MKKVLFIALGALPLVLLSLNWSPVALMQTSGAIADNAVSFRVVFGEKQERPKDYSGSISLSAGKLLGIKPWRFFGTDTIEGGAAWKLQTKAAVFEAQPDMPRPLSTPGQIPNLVPAGITVTVEAPPTAIARIRTAQGSFEFPLRDLRGGRVLWFADGDAWVQQTPSARQISPPATGAGSEEHDHPSLTVTRQNVTWIAWQAYQNNGDNVYARYSTASGWSEPYRLTDEKGDIFRTALAEDSQGRIWAVWSERTGQNWDLYAKTFARGAWSARRKLTSANAPNTFQRLVADRAGTLHLVWTGYQDGESHVYWSKLNGDAWTPPREISGVSAWAPDAACDSKGNLYVAWDSYRTGNYDIFLRTVSADGTLGALQQVTHSPRFQAHASLAVDKQDRVWLAWDESGSNWGKDYNRDDTWRGTTLYSDRHPRIAVLENGQWKQPAADIVSAVPNRYNRYSQLPKLAVAADGRIWVSLQLRTAAGMSRTDFWAANGHWERFITSLEGGRWTPLAPIPESNSRNEAPFEMRAGPSRLWMTWATDNRPMVGQPGQGAANAKGQKKGQQKAVGGPARTPPVYEVDAASFATDMAVQPPLLAAFQETGGNAASLHLNEPADVARMRSYRTTVQGANYRIVRGDFHRHTEISTDGAGDGSLNDYFRYMLDAAAMDTGVITDHNAGNDNEYTWWRTEKAHDLFLIPGRYTPLFGYERSVPYPNGHRNIVFAQRGVRTLPIGREEQQGQLNTGPILYPYLKQNRGIAMLHSLATDQGSDYRDNNPDVEPLVEIYQGYHANYEYEGAPRSETAGYVASAHGKLQPAGYYWNALAKGFLLGVQSSSDHISTHSSYSLIYTPGPGREQIVESMRKRHAYGATDNILVDYTATDAGGRVYMMGDSFTSATPPKLSVKVTGTYKIAKIEIVKDGQFVFTTQPEGNTAQFTFVDTNPGKAVSYYYVRVIQVDRNLAWSSPIWVNYGK
jgi:hypothetical protein